MRNATLLDSTSRGRSCLERSGGTRAPRLWTERSGTVPSTVRRHSGSAHDALPLKKRALAETVGMHQSPSADDLVAPGASQCGEVLFEAWATQRRVVRRIGGERPDNPHPDGAPAALRRASWFPTLQS